jgi:hypothetical protein
LPAEQSTARARLASQGLARPLRSPARAVALLVGVQGQDAAWGRWSIGLRVRGSTDAKVAVAIASGTIVRTWAFRGTLHYLAADDAAWIVSLLAPRIIAGNRRRYAQLGLDDATLESSSRQIRRSIQEEGPLTRGELGARLERAGIPAGGQRLPYMLQRAALDGLIRHGAGPDRDPTFTAAPLGGAPARRADRAQAAATPGSLAALAARYVAGHGPATAADFAWWSGLPAAGAREAFDDPGAPVPPPEPADPRVHLLPPFDDYLLGYKDRTAVLNPLFARDVNAGGGVPRPTVLVDGAVAGTWSRVERHGRIVVTPRMFRRLAGGEPEALQAAVERYGAFVGMPAGLS